MSVWVDRTERERGDATGLEPGRVHDLVGRATRTSSRRPHARDRCLVGATVAGHEREHVGAVADEHERLDDLAELAADRRRGVARGRRARR